MAIPPFDDRGLLPEGVHNATWSEVCERFGQTEHRQQLLRGLEQALASLSKAGCAVAYIDGSFVTTKEHPNDFDACWDEDGVNPDDLHPALLVFDDRRALQKAVFGGELFPASVLADSAGSPFLRFFQTDRGTGERKGIVAITLEEWSR